MSARKRLLLVAAAVVITGFWAPSAAAARKKITVIPCPEPKPRFDHTKIDRTLKEPRYASARPMYRFYAFGLKGKQVVALVIDESQGTGKGYDVMYVDFNGNRDITEPGEKVSLLSAEQPKPARGHVGFFHVTTSAWGKPPVINDRKIEIDDPLFDYEIRMQSAGIRVDCVLEDGSWHTSLRTSDKSALWSPEKEKAQVYRFGGMEFSPMNEHVRGKVLKPGEFVSVDLTCPFFAGSSPSVDFRQARNWVSAGYDDVNVRLESLEDPGAEKVDITIRGY